MNKKTFTHTNVTSVNSRNIIRNPMRKTLQKNPFEGYQPEHERLELKPQLMYVAPTDFSFSKKRKEPTMTQPTQHHTSIPDRMNVQSGRNREHHWYPSEADDVAKSEKYANSEITYDEIPSVPEDDTEGFESQKEILPLNLDSIAALEYFISIGDEIIYSAASLEEAEGLIEVLIFDSESPFHGISVEEIAIFQRLELKFGVHIKKQ